jgi:uncharacterized iron-regulated membrane protein
MHGEPLSLILGIAAFLAIIPAAILVTTLSALLGWSERRRHAPGWRPHPAFLALTWILLIGSGLTLLGIGTCTGNVLINGLR